MATIHTSIQLEDRMSRQFAAMNMAMLSSIDYMQQLETASGNMIDTSALEHAQRELQQMDAYYNQLEQEILQSDRAQGNLNRTISQGEDIAKGLLGTIGAIAGTYLSFQGLKSLIGASDEMTSTTARVQLLVDDMPIIPDQQANVDFNALGMSDIDAAQQLIYESAQRSYSSFKDTADMVARIGSNAGDAFGSTAEVIAFSELVQKQFGIAGASAAEAGNATLQLSQALASGVLRGDELNSIFEQAPNLIHSIADYMGEPIGRIREMAADGMITADIVKNAMFAASDDINKKFDSMPITWSQLWTYFQNGAQRSFGNVLGYINEIANSERMRELVDAMISNLAMIASVVMGALQAMTTVGSFLYDNWSAISPVVTMVSFAVSGLALALGAVVAAKMATALWTSITTTAATLYAAATGAGTGATWAMVSAAWGLNTALAANPVFLIVMGIMLLIGVIYAAVAAINHFADTSYSATGIVAGVFAALGAFIYNIVAIWWNLFASVTEFFVNVWQHRVYSVKALFVNLANTALNVAESMIGSFDTAATNLANMFIDAANMAVKAINWVIEALNNVPGIDIGTIGEFSHKTSITADYSGLRDKMDNWLREAPTDYWEAPKMELKSIPDSYMSGYNWGEDLFSKDQSSKDKQITNSYDDLAALSGLGDMANALDDMKDPGKETAKNTKKLADSATILGDDLKYMRDLTEREAINRYTTAEIKIDARSENHISSEADLDGIIDGLVEKLEEAAEMAAEGAR